MNIQIIFVFIFFKSIESCSNFFRYETNLFSETVGKITIPNVQFNQVLMLEVHMSIATIIQGVNNKIPIN